MQFYLKALAVFLILISIIILGSSLINPADAKENREALIQHAVKVEQAYNLPPYLLQAVCEHESRWRNVAGRHGEIGVCQVKPSTASFLYPGYEPDSQQKLFAWGSKGDNVARIQAVLAREKYYEAAVDGLYGPITDRAVRGYQRDRNLLVDGLVGPRTWRSLFGPHDRFPGKTIVQSLWNPQENLEWAARYLVWLRDNVSPDPAIMLAAYNGGPGHPIVRYMLGVQKRQKRLRFSDTLSVPSRQSLFKY